MKYKNQNGEWVTLKRFEVTRGDYIREDQELGVLPNLKCECGNDKFYVAWWNYDFTGGYCRVICTACGNDEILINDYA